MTVAFLLLLTIGLHRMLVEERNLWKKEFEEGKKPVAILEDYRHNRDSNLWRTSRSVEQLCEYILFLEGKVHGKYS